ncbi:glycosyltransferase family 2 protein [Flagellimonas hymeniacidonis]|uniref:Glycosyltransferase family 2 protein n=1 Tax=Flagellimonas hymeniacidonis TaxID=2603628 RepID=A0A5C8V1D6_9FLAO|nr:glycosyltransferase family 2 protein [Flagellimonas hymeniacidonis]TXN35593.1 glycosyltransferase family 2 protein [Flagellimonas hymeniacidonis]
MKVAVVILNWNGKALLERFLPSVIAHSSGASIHLVDNASGDDSIAFVKNAYPQINIVENSENGGFAKGYNDGLKHIEADVFCLLNSDVEVTPNWLNPILNAFDSLPNAGIIQPKILDLKRKEYFEYAGAAGGFIDKLGYPFCRGRIFQVLEKDEGQYDDIKEVFWATGACMFIKSDVFKLLNGFDEDYFAHQEEIDLCWRAKNAGHKVFYVGESKVYHLGGSTLENMNPKKTFLNFRNSLYSITKNLPRKKALFIIFMRLLLDGIAALRFIFQFKFSHCIAILRAHLSFYANFRKLYKKREKANFILNYYSTTSIVWSHFVHQVKNFNILVKD